MQAIVDRYMGTSATSPVSSPAPEEIGALVDRAMQVNLPYSLKERALSALAVCLADDGTPSTEVGSAIFPPAVTHSPFAATRGLTRGTQHWEALESSLRAARKEIFRLMETVSSVRVTWRDRRRGSPCAPPSGQLPALQNEPRVQGLHGRVGAARATGARWYRANGLSVCVVCRCVSVCSIRGTVESSPRGPTRDRERGLRLRRHTQSLVEGAVSTAGTSSPPARVFPPLQARRRELADDISMSRSTSLRTSGRTRASSVSPPSPNRASVASFLNPGRTSGSALGAFSRASGSVSKGWLARACPGYQGRVCVSESFVPPQPRSKVIRGNTRTPEVSASRPRS